MLRDTIGLEPLTFKASDFHESEAARITRTVVEAFAKAAGPQPQGPPPLHVQVAEVDGWSRCWQTSLGWYGVCNDARGKIELVPPISTAWAWQVATENGLTVRFSVGDWAARGKHGGIELQSARMGSPELAVASWYVLAFKRDGKRARS